MDCSPPGSSVHGISRARILEWVAISFSRAWSQLRNLFPVSCVSGGATRETSKQQMLFSCSVVSNSLQPHGLQHTRLPCPSLPPRVCQSSCPLNQRCHPTISYSVLVSFCLQSFPASGSFPMNWLFVSDGQSIRALALASVLPMSIQCWFRLRLTGLIPWLSKGLSRVLSSTTVQKHQFFGTQPSLWSSSYISTWLLERP